MTDSIVKNPPFSSSYFGNTIFCEVISALTKCSGSSVAALNGDKKTKNVYIMTGEDKDTNNYNANSSKYGDAVYETSSNGNSNNGSWYNNASYFIYTVWPFFDRGGYYKSNFKAGMFCFGGHWGTSVEYESFRPVLSVI